MFVVFSVKSLNFSGSGTPISLSMKTLSAFIISIALAFGSELIAQPSSPYQQGLEQLYRGQVDEALQTWETNYEEELRVDARIGFEYIRIVTEREFSDRFETATEMYYKALLNGSGVNSRIAVRQEIERLKAIVGDGIYRQWTEWWESENKELRADIRGFWIQLDPTPARLVNERLIEHWQRIAEARQRYNKNSSTIYGTDERANIFVRYGEPDRVQSGILTLQDLNVKPWLQRQITQRDDIVREDREMRDIQNERSADQSYSAMQAETIEFIIYDNHRYPEFEIWFYDDIATEGKDSVPFIFGTNIRNDRFEQISAVDDFIPERAFNVTPFREREMADFTRVGITPALMLQMLYYEQLSTIDPFFEERLNRLRDMVLEQGPEAYSGMDLNFKKESANLVRQRSLNAPRQRSSIESKIPVIPTNVYQYRFLDRDQKPYLITFLESEPREAFMIDFTRNRPDDVTLGDLQQADTLTNVLPGYTLQHSLQKYDGDWNIEKREVDTPHFRFQRDQFRPGALSVFRSSHEGRKQRSVSAELMNLDEDSRGPAFDTPYPKSTRGLGAVHYREPEPLKTSPDSLQLADLVLGYQIREDSDEMFPFTVANNQIIPWQETLVLHFEVYNLTVQPSGFSRFELTYRILPVDEDGRILTEQEEFILTLNFTSEENRLIEDLEIETADLNPGLYELHLQISDVHSTQTRNRKTRFEVLDR